MFDIRHYTTNYTKFITEVSIMQTLFVPTDKKVLPICHRHSYTFYLLPLFKCTESIVHTYFLQLNIIIILLKE